MAAHLKRSMSGVRPGGVADWLRSRARARRAAPPVLVPIDGTESLPCLFASNRYGSYCVPYASRQRPAAQAIVNGDVWEPETLAFIADRVDGDVVHAGTYFGDFLPALAQAVGSKGLVWAFEPNPENYRCALITAALNDAAPVRLRAAALGDGAGSAQLEVTSGDGVALGGGSRVVTTEGDIAVTVLAIDDVVPADRNVSVLQLDVEGFEEPALTGALATIERCRPLIIVENLPSEAWIASHLSPLGYRATERLHMNTVFTPPHR